MTDLVRGDDRYLGVLQGRREANDPVLSFQRAENANTVDGPGVKRDADNRAAFMPAFAKAAAEPPLASETASSWRRRAFLRTSRQISTVLLHVGQPEGLAVVVHVRGVDGLLPCHRLSLDRASLRLEQCQGRAFLGSGYHGREILYRLP